MQLLATDFAGLLCSLSTTQITLDASPPGYDPAKSSYPAGSTFDVPTGSTATLTVDLTGNEMNSFLSRLLLFNNFSLRRTDAKYPVARACGSASDETVFSAWTRRRTDSSHAPCVSTDSL